MNDPSGVDRRRHQMERALAALAGSGLDSARFTVVLEPASSPGDIGSIDRSMTVVMAVGFGGLGAFLKDVAPENLVAWVADACAEPNRDAIAVDEVMSGWHIGTAFELQSDPPPGADEVAGWLVLGPEAPIVASDAELLAAIEEALQLGESPSRTAKAVSINFGVPKRRVYDLVLSLGDGH